MPRVLITGAYGLLGSTLSPTLESRGHIVIRHGRALGCDAVAELSEPDEVAVLLSRTRPDVVVNLAAATEVDRCETHPEMAVRSNVLPAVNLARAIANSGGRVRLVQLSTDHVYDGAGPHREGAVRPRNAYAWSKYAAEAAATAVRAVVLRTNFFGRSRCARRSSFSDWVVNAATERRAVHLHDDVLFTPLSMKTLSGVVDRVIRGEVAGVFNVGSRGGMSKAAFALTLLDVLGRDASFASIGLSAETRRDAYRPTDMRMDSTVFERAFGMQLPTLDEEIASAAMEYER